MEAEDTVINNAPAERGGGTVRNKREEIEKAVRASISDPRFSVERLAEAVGLSVSYLREIAESEYGTGPRWLIETIRIEEALKMLADGGGSVFSISRKVGYSNVRSFRKAFEKRVNMSPSECRDYLHKEKDEDTLFATLVKRLDGGEKFR